MEQPSDDRRRAVLDGLLAAALLLAHQLHGDAQLAEDYVRDRLVAVHDDNPTPVLLAGAVAAAKPSLDEAEL